MSQFSFKVFRVRTIEIPVGVCTVRTHSNVNKMKFFVVTKSGFLRGVSQLSVKRTRQLC